MDQDIEQTTKKSLFQNKKVIIIVGIIALVVTVVAILVLVLGRQTTKQTNETIIDPTPTISLPDASFYFGDEAQSVVPNQEATVDIYIDTQGRKVSAAVISISFDPVLVTNVGIEQIRDPNSAISNAFENSEGQVDERFGIASISLVTALTTPLQKGRGAVARLTFTPLGETSITFSDNSALLSRDIEDPILVSKGTINVVSEESIKALQDRLQQQQNLISQ